MSESTLVTAQSFPSHTILLVDDNPDDTYLFERAWKTAAISNPLAVVSDGDQAIAYLTGAEPFSNRLNHAFPLIVLVDLNMPRKNGFELIEWIRQQPHLKSLTVEVITSQCVPRTWNARCNWELIRFMLNPAELTIWSISCGAGTETPAKKHF